MTRNVGLKKKANGLCREVRKQRKIVWDNLKKYIEKGREEDKQSLRKKRRKLKKEKKREA